MMIKESIPKNYSRDAFLVGVSDILCKSDHRSRHDSIDYRTYTKNLYSLFSNFLHYGRGRYCKSSA